MIDGLAPMLSRGQPIPTVVVAAKISFLVRNLSLDSASGLVEILITIAVRLIISFAPELASRI
jgi:hypothetical protein